ncbi:hypothetical protein [Psychrobacillus sp. FSL K6-2843]|uniref:hypothetical protein n=1 Tax=Psychrobacillus sp. FSL K6-2843 TaxID=2921549 RepID=UPI00315A0899
MLILIVNYSPYFEQRLIISVSEYLTKHPLAIHVAQNQRYTPEDENVYRTGIGYYGWERKVDQLWCHRAHPLV